MGARLIAVYSEGGSDKVEQLANFYYGDSDKQIVIRAANGFMPPFFNNFRGFLNPQGNAQASVTWLEGPPSISRARRAGAAASAWRDWAISE